MGFNFRHASIPSEATRRYDLGLATAPGAPTVILYVRHAGESNSGYRNALFKYPQLRTAAAMAAASRHVTPTLEQQSEYLSEVRTRDAFLFANHVIVSWENVTEDGHPVPFSPDAAMRLLQAMIQPPPEGTPWVFDTFTRFAEAINNFTAQTIEATALGKG